MVTNTVIQKPEMRDNTEYKINRRTREGKLLYSLLNKDQIKSAKLVKVIKRYDEGQTYEENGVHVQWETPLLISMARDINNHPNCRKEDVVNVVATEMIQTEYSDKPRYVAYTTVGDEPEAFAFDAISYDSDLEREARRRAMSTDQVEDLRMAWLKLETARKNKEAHEAKLAEVKANHEFSDFEKYRLRDIQENLTRLETQLQKPVEETPQELIKRAKMLLKKELLQLFVNNVGKPFCERTYRDSWSHGRDGYGIQTFNDIIAYITTQWKSSDWGHENYLDQVVVREVYEIVR